MQAGAATEKNGTIAGTVLLVEDSNLIRQLVIEMLQEGGFFVHAAGDGPAALELFLTEFVDVVVTDLTMPTMDGLALIRELRLRKPSARTVLMTGYGDASELVQSAAEAPDLVLIKPFKPSELLEAVRWLLGGGEP